MTKIDIDGILKDWGERLSYSPIKGQKGRNIRSGGNRISAVNQAAESGLAIREKFVRTVRKAPEVMVKISGGGKNMQHITAHMEYISRKGSVELEDENGDLHLGKEGVEDVCESWAKGKIGIPYVGAKRKEAFNVVLSMPAGTDRQAVKDAARAFSIEQFSNHQYVFAAHDDEQHPHVHLTVKAVDHDGVRLNPRKGDLQNWRVLFAAKLRDHGVEANATPRRARGIVQKAEKQAVMHINKDYRVGKRRTPARVSLSQRVDVRTEIETGTARPNPAQERIQTTRKEIHTVYGQVARALASGDAADQALALDIVRFVQQIPPSETQHQNLVKRLRDNRGHDARLSKDLNKMPERGS